MCRPPAVHRGGPECVQSARGHQGGPERRLPAALPRPAAREDAVVQGGRGAAGGPGGEDRALPRTQPPDAQQVLAEERRGDQVPDEE